MASASRAEAPGARWWHAEGERVRCELCPRSCLLKEGQRAFCFVRRVEGGRLVLDTWGRSTGFCIDPIEKKPLNHFLPGTPVLSFGTAGCNLGCRFCQNWDISKARTVDRLAVRARPERIAAAAARSGSRSVAFTYNDPVPWAEYAIDTAAACHELGVRTVAVTAGYVSAGAREAFFGAMDAANVDLKSFSDDFYRRLCFGRLEPVLETVEWLAREARTWLELTTLLVPGQNDSDAELHGLAGWVAEKLGCDVPLHFSAFHPDFRVLDLAPTSAATLRRARRIAMEHGIRYVYTGNVHDPEGDRTLCPGCGLALIERDWYRLLAWRLDRGRCGRCGTEVAGVFEDRPGDWGARRERVAIG